MADLWQSNQTSVWVQQGGAGNAWQLLDADATVGAISGGGQTVADRWTRDINSGAGAYKRAGVQVDSDPERFTFDLMTRWRVASFLKKLRDARCKHGLMINYHCGVVDDPINYNASMVAAETFGVGNSFNENIANGLTTVAPDLQRTVSESASEIILRRVVQHLDISGTVNDIAFNDVISVGVAQCAGDCGGENDGNQDFWAVTDFDATPGYQSIATPMFWYTSDGGTTWSSKYIDVALSANALRVYQNGAYVFAVLGASGVAYAKFSDITAGVANPWALATGLSGLTVNALGFASGLEVYAACNTGRIAKSTDGGFSFTTVSAGAQTTQNLNDVKFASATLGWFVGNSGAVVKFYNGALSLVTISGLTSNINTVDVPEDREREVYIGMANGTVQRSRDTGVTWEAKAFPLSGTGAIKMIRFSGYQGQELFLVQHNVGGTKSRVLRDISGGFLGRNTEVIGSFDSPNNLLINAIAPSDDNVALSVGEVRSGQAFIGKIS